MESLIVVLFLIFLAGSVVPLLWRRGIWGDQAAYFSSLIGSSVGLIVALSTMLGGGMERLALWEMAPGFMLRFQLDPLSAFFLFILSLVGIGVSIYALAYGKEYSRQGKGVLVGFSWNLFFLTMILVLLAADAFSFLFFWEAMSLISFLLVMTEHEVERVRKAGFLYIAMTHLGSLFLFLSFLILYWLTGSYLFSDWGEMVPKLGEGLRSFLFIALLIGFGTKAGLMPFHIWLPKAHPVAPSHVSAMMSAVMLKVAVYGMIRFFIEVLGEPTAWWGGVLLGIGLLSAFLGSLYGAAQNEMKSFLAYSSSENMGLIAIGIGAALLFQANENPFLASFTLGAALFHSLNHALFKGVLFMGAGSVLYATHTSNGNLLGGLIHRMPQTAVLFLIGGVAMAAFPPLNGFISEWMLFQSLIHLSFASPSVWQGMVGILAAVFLGMIGALVAGGVVKHFGAAFLAVPRTEAAEHAKEVPLSMRLGMGMFAFFLFLFGLFPGIALSLIQGVILSIGLKRIYFQALSIRMPQGETSILPSLILLLLVLILGASIVVLRSRLGKERVDFGKTWNCGTPYRPSMAYTATSISHPLLMMFRSIVPLERKVSVRGEYAYFPKRISYRIEVHSIFERILYRPVWTVVLFLSEQIRRIQNGSLQTYLLYMVVTLILLMLWAQRG